MVCADGVYELGTVKDTQFVAEAKALGGMTYQGSTIDAKTEDIFSYVLPVFFR